MPLSRSISACKQVHVFVQCIVSDYAHITSIILIVKDTVVLYGSNPSGANATATTVYVMQWFNVKKQSK